MPNPIECIFLIIALFCIFLGISFVLSILYSFKKINTSSNTQKRKNIRSSCLKGNNTNYAKVNQPKQTHNNVYYVKNYKPKKRRGAKIPFEGVVISPEEFKNRKINN